MRTPHWCERESRPDLVIVQVETNTVLLEVVTRYLKPSRVIEVASQNTVEKVSGKGLRRCRVPLLERPHAIETEVLGVLQAGVSHAAQRRFAFSDYAIPTTTDYAPPFCGRGGAQESLNDLRTRNPHQGDALINQEELELINARTTYALPVFREDARLKVSDRLKDALPLRRIRAVDRLNQRA
ncbi:hypothetical protein ACIQY8_30760 [Streptomyces albidoflavus]